MSAPTPRLGRRSLTARLVTGVVALAGVLVALISTATYFALRSFLNDQFDGQLRSTAVQNAAFIPRCLQSAEPTLNGAYECPSGPQGRQEWIAAIDLQTKQLILFRGQYGNSVQPLELSVDEQQRVVQQKRRFTTEVGGASLLVEPQVSNDGSLLILTGLSDRDLRSTLNRLVAIEVVIGAAAVALALAATTFGVRRSLRNLYRVTGTARDVAAELSASGSGLDRRVSVTERGTEVGQLAESMNTLLSAVETQFAARIESERRMRQFLADASHELRTPLTSIRGYAELARMQRAVSNGNGTGNGSEDADNLNRIESEGTRMSRLVDDLLLLARGDDTKSPRTDDPVDVAAVLEDVVETSRVAHPDRPIDISVGDLPAVLGDREQLLRAVRNLVTNAAVHTEAGRPILVSAGADGDEVVVQVADGGPGLPPEEAAHVFERFWRADKARTRARGGSGLGMSIVAAIVRAHGGAVRFDSSVEAGSTVTVRLPAAHSARASA